MPFPRSRPAGRGHRATAAALITALVGAGLTVGVVTAAPAQAKTVAQAERESRQAKADARTAAARVDALLDRYDRASGQVADGVERLSGAFAQASSADVTHQEAAAQEQRAQALERKQILDVYAAGGSAGVLATVLSADSPDDALWRATTASRVMGSVLADSRSSSQQKADDTAVADHRAALADAAATEQAAALEQLQRRQKVAAAALTQAQGTLAHLSKQAKQAKVALAAAKRIKAAQARAAAAARTAAGPVTAIGIPAQYLADYQAAAKTCSGMSWTLLAAVGQVESGHGRNMGPSSAGAIGPMQFMPGTFSAYAVDGDHDGTTDAWDPEDAIFTAAHYLCVLGAKGGSPDGIQRSLFGYNHAQWYVDLVLSAERSIIAAQH